MSLIVKEFQHSQGNKVNILQEANNVIDKEISGIVEVKQKLNESFEELIKFISSSNGRVVMCGMGKSGHIAKKIFATLVSTGTPSMFMHPAEAFHGDLGMIQPEDIFFAISNSGETAEVTQLLPFIKSNGNTFVSMTGDSKSTLAKASDYHIDIGVTREACPLNLAPTTSTTASLVIGDAIAVALMKTKNFKEENFAKYHPGGSLGQKLLMTVKDFMHEVKFVTETCSLLEIMTEMSSSKTGLVLVGDSGSVSGVITDGDIRRRILQQPDAIQLNNIRADNVMTANPKTISAVTRCGDADMKMKELGVNSLIVEESGLVLGIYDNINRKK